MTKKRTTTFSEGEEQRIPNRLLETLKNNVAAPRSIKGRLDFLQLKEQGLMQSSFHSLLLVTAIKATGAAQKYIWMRLQHC